MSKCERSDCNQIAEVKIVSYNVVEIVRCIEHAIAYIEAMQELLGTGVPIQHKRVSPNEKHD